jgi:ABC-2 type transport system ATP-binding protein
MVEDLPLALHEVRKGHPMDAVEVRGLRKSYGAVEAVGGIDLTIEHGEVFALLGPNGAGKTTVVEILEGYRQRTAGEVCVLGMDPATGGTHLRERIGIVLQSSGLYPELTVAEAVGLHAAYYPHPFEVDEVIDLVGLTDVHDHRIKRLSGGFKRRVDMALGIIGDPEVLFLDEPTAGFDPSARRKAWRVIGDLCSLGTTVVLTTHYLDEAQRLADRVAVINAGTIVATGTPDDLGGPGCDIATLSFRRPGWVSIAELPAAVQHKAELRGGLVLVHSDDPTRDLHELTAWALRYGEDLHGLVVERPSLEDVYLQLIGAAGDGHA